MVSEAKQSNYQIHPLDERIRLEMGGIPYPPHLSQTVKYVQVQLNEIPNRFSCS